MVYFGQVVIGAPGAGKTTYCQGMKMFLHEIGRPCDIINVDFANDSLPYECSVDVRELVSIERVMEEHGLGPNGGLVYCMEHLLANIDWLIDRISALDSRYMIFDFPGQVELYSHHTCVQDLVNKLVKALDIRLCSVHLVDSFHCSKPYQFISAVLLVISTMLRLGLPHVNVLSKIDLLSMYDPLPFNLDFYTEMLDLMPMVRYIGDNAVVPDLKDIKKKEEANKKKAKNAAAAESAKVGYMKKEEDEEDEQEEEVMSNLPPSKLQLKFKKMTTALCDLVNDFGLVSFVAMNIQDAETVGNVLAKIDIANGHSLTSFESEQYVKAGQAQRKEQQQGHSMAAAAAGQQTGPSLQSVFKLASKSSLDSLYSQSMSIQEKYGGDDDTEAAKVHAAAAIAAGLSKRK